ncbi:MAG: hydrogenase maturation nickel metallochaperone HypA [Firmicutes bacterium]|nr:hydrogenase maturation nickel metallochaperone HypA [Bacillota bacterium]
MHELGIVFQVMDSLQAVAEENHLTQIHSVTLQVGEVSTVIPDYLTDCWRWAVQKREPPLLGCEMKTEVLPAVSWCQDCAQEYGTVAHGRICPYCGSEKTWLLRGNELNIKEIEAI